MCVKFVVTKKLILLKLLLLL